MKSRTATEASRNFADLLDAVEAGESVTITRAGRPVAEIRQVSLESLDERYRRYRLEDRSAERAMRRSLERYGQISPKDCYKGGQETNCRINQLILRCAESGWQTGVHFIETPHRFALETALIQTHHPPWNR